MQGFDYEPKGQSGTFCATRCKGGRSRGGKRGGKGEAAGDLRLLSSRICSRQTQEIGEDNNEERGEKEERKKNTLR